MAFIPVAANVPRANLGALRAPAIGVPEPEQDDFEGLGVIAEDLRLLAETKLDEAETDEAKDLDNQLADELRTRMNGDGSEDNPGYYSLRGTEAIDAHDTVSLANDEGIARLAEGASSDRVRRKFELAASARREAELDRMSTHVGTARIDRDNITSAARQDQALQDAAIYYNDTKPGGMVEQSIGIARQEAAGDAQRNGLDAEATKVYIAQAESKVHAAVLTRMIKAGDDKLAEEYFEDNWTKITDPTQLANFEEQIIETTKVAESQATTEMLLADAGGDFKLAKQMARDQLKGEEEDVVIVRLTRLKADAKEADVVKVGTWVDKNFSGDGEADLAAARKKYPPGSNRNLAVADIKARLGEGAEAEIEKARKIVDVFGKEFEGDYQKQRDVARSIYKDQGNMLTRVLAGISTRETEANAVDNKEREDAYQRSANLIESGKVYADIPADDKLLLSLRQRESLQKGTTEANVELNGKFNKMLQRLNTGIDDEFLTHDLNQYIGEMPATTLQWWQAQQTAANSDNPAERFKHTRVTNGVMAANKVIKSILAPALTSTSKNKSIKETAKIRKAAAEDHMRQFVTDWHENNIGNMPPKVLNEEVYSMLVTGTVFEDEFAFGFADERSDEMFIKGQKIGDETFLPDLEDEENLTIISRATGISGGILPEVIKAIQAAGLPVTLNNLRAAIPFIGK